MKTVCAPNSCTGCMMCVSRCAKNAIHVEDGEKAFNAWIDETQCINCGLCEQECPSNRPVEKHTASIWKQGWASNECVRLAGSSGGVASAIGNAFIKDGGAVCACVFDGGTLVFELADKVEAAKKFAGSKYVKSNPGGIYPKIKRLLQEGKKVLFIGLPCQVAAVQRYTDHHPALYTIDLICHGTPSEKLLRQFLFEKRININEMYDLKFRKKDEFYLSDAGKRIVPPSVFDQYTYTFLRGLCYTEACYSCQYAEISRISDITLGDSWGSQLPMEEQKKGVSLILCQTEKGKRMLDLADVHLENVDINVAVENNKQLQKPSSKPEQYNLFWKTFLRTGKFCAAVNICYPIVFFKQKVKAVLIRAGILKRGDSWQRITYQKGN